MSRSAAGANGGVEPPAITSFDPIAGRIAGVAPGEGVLEVFTDFSGDEGAFHLAAFVTGGAFTIDTAGGGSENAVIFESAQPLRPGILRVTFTDGARNASEFAVAE